MWFLNMFDKISCFVGYFLAAAAVYDIDFC